MHFSNKKYRNHRGIGLLELMLSLSIIAVLLLSAVRYYEVSQRMHKTETTLQNIQVLYAAGEKWLDDIGDFNQRPSACTSGDSLLTCFANYGFVPKNFAPIGAAVDPWDGTIIAQGKDDEPNKLKLLFSSVPNSACKNIQRKLHDNANVVCTISDNLTMTVTFP